jgi:hypothetical protein
MTLSDISIRVFMRCLFNKDYTGVDNWDDIYVKYIDESGICKNGLLEIDVAIHNLTARLTHITGWLEFQAKVFNQTGKPYEPLFADIHKYGHRPTVENFEEQLNRIEAKEKKNVSQLKRMNKEKEALQKVAEPGTVNARNSFLTMLNVISKEQGYKIDKDTTDMEELCVMIKDHNEQARRMEQENK